MKRFKFLFRSAYVLNFNLLFWFWIDFYDMMDCRKWFGCVKLLVRCRNLKCCNSVRISEFNFEKCVLKAKNLNWRILFLYCNDEERMKKTCRCLNSAIGTQKCPEYDVQFDNFNFFRLFKKITSIRCNPRGGLRVSSCKKNNRAKKFVDLAETKLEI